MGKSRNSVVVGEKYNSWTVVSGPIVYRGKSGYWNVECECGTSKVCDGYTLVKGTSKRCRQCHNKRIGEIKKKHGDSVAARQAFGSHVSKARRRGLLNELDFDKFYVLSKQDCFYCGSAPQPGYWTNSKYRKDWQDGFVHNGIDRFDNAYGYTIKNSVPCCTRCNRAKNDMSVPQWISHILAWSEWAEEYIANQQESR